MVSGTSVKHISHISCLACLNDPDVLLPKLAADIVERVVLLGAPIAIKDENWEAARKVINLLEFFFSALLFEASS